MSRIISDVAADVRAHWPRVSPHAAPYLEAMAGLESLDDRFGLDSARSVVLYFLANAGNWTGPDARRVKAELSEMLERHDGQ